MKNERRKHTRVPVHFEVYITAGRRKTHVETWDVSLRGMKCTCDRPLQEGGSCTVTFVLAPDITFRINGKIVRSSSRQTAIHFESMDEESFFHLKRVVQYNADDPDRIDHEIACPPREKK